MGAAGATGQTPKNPDPCADSNGAAKKPCRRDIFGSVAAWTAKASGSRWASLGALMTVIIWAAVGPYYGYSENWQLVINTGTTIVTFLMVFLIQNSQNRESKAVHLKLDELIHAVKRADNQMINIETLTEEQLDMLAGRYEEIARPLHEKLESAVEDVEEKIVKVDEHLASYEANGSRFDRRLPTTSRTDPIPSPASNVASS